MKRNIVTTTMSNTGSMNSEMAAPCDTSPETMPVWKEDRRSDHERAEHVAAIEDEAITQGRLRNGISDCDHRYGPS